MDKKEFYVKVIEKMNEYLGAGYEIELRKVNKNNGLILDGMTIKKDGTDISPTIYLNSYFSAYKDGRSFDQLFVHMVRSFESCVTPDIDPRSLEDFDNISSRILYKLINAEKNRKMLDEVPHILWNDLAIVFFYSFPEGPIGNATFTIRNEHMSSWGITLDDLVRCSRENMPRNAPAQLIPLSRMVALIMGDTDSLDEGDDMFGDDIKCEDPDEIHTPMYVLSNKDRMFGAAAMIYSNRIGMLAEHVQHNIYILPSSIHEVILLPDEGGGDTDYLRSTIKEVNETQVESEEVLSDSLYYFDRKTQKITVVCA